MAHRIKIFGCVSGWVKIHKIPNFMFKITGQFFFKLCITLSVSVK